MFIVDVRTALGAISVPPQESGEVWGVRLAQGSLVVGKSYTRLHLIGPPVPGVGRMQVDGCTLDPCVAFHWVEDGEPRIGTVSSFSVLRDTSATTEAFGQAVQSLVGFLGFNPGGPALVEILEAWLVVLSASNAPTLEELAGFWGELLAIKHSGDPVRAVNAWQWRDAALIDFSSGTTQVEVKTSSASSRVHTLSLRQLREGVVRDASILSISTYWSPEGLGLAELIRQVADAVRLDDQAVQTVAAAVARRVGLAVGSDECLLDEGAAVDSMELIRFETLAGALAIPALVDGRLSFDLALLPAGSRPSGALASWLLGPD